MSNRIKATISFHFKGELYSPSILIDLDDYMRAGATLPNLCSVIAKENNIDFYSYQYEMMQAEMIHYSEAEGLVSKYVNDGCFDIVLFEQDWKEQICLEKLTKIAINRLGINDLEQEPKIKQALLDAYNLGESSVENILVAESTLDF